MFFTFSAFADNLIWSVKHVGKYLSGYTSYGSGTGFQSLPYFRYFSPRSRSMMLKFRLYCILHSWKGAFSDLDEAKTKCVELMATGKDCGGITEVASGFQLRVGPSLRDSSRDENAFVLYYYVAAEDFDITLEKWVLWFIGF